MPEYVYALHDFVPEHEDEISFKAGEKIEVVERDDLYGDGWWQGKNTTGKQGLFPQSYTSSIPPTSTEASGGAGSTSSSDSARQSSATISSPTTLTALNEEPETESETQNPSIRTTPTIQLNGDVHHHSDTEDNNNNNGENNEMMKATMTDVQKAIEQLGHTQDPGDNRSFSFVSERDTEGETTDTDFDPSDAEGVGGEGQGEDWHKGARTKLAEKARRAVEEAEKMERMMSEGVFSRLVVPPIEVEMSDESEDEDEHEELTRRLNRSESFDIPEEDEEDEDDERHRQQQQLNLPSERDEDESGQPTATMASFPSMGNRTTASPEPEEASASAPAASVPDVPSTPHAHTSQDIPKSTINGTYSPIRESLIALPSPTGSSTKHSSVASSTLIFATMQQQQQQQNNNASAAHSKQPSTSSSAPGSGSGSGIVPGTSGSVLSPLHIQEASASTLNAASASASNVPPQSVSSSSGTMAERNLLAPVGERKDSKDSSKEGSKHPSEWNVQEVVDWLKSKGFDGDVCEKFVEQEITGDVLLELDTSLLKSEIGIMAFGKRVRIANAISELRRPPSISYSDGAVSQQQSPFSPFAAHLQQQQSQHQLQQLQQQGGQAGMNTGMGGYATPPPPHLRTHSRGHSFHSSSVGSPMSMRYENGGGGAGQSALGTSIVMSPESPIGQGGMMMMPGSPMDGRPASEGAEPSIRAGSEGGGGANGGGVGLGLGLGFAMGMGGVGMGSGVTEMGMNGGGKAMKNRPAQLQLSSSPSDTALSKRALGGDDDDKAALSESELPSNTQHSSVRRRFFGRSQQHHDGGSSSKDKDHKDKDKTPDTAASKETFSSSSPLSAVSGKDKGGEAVPRARSRSGRSVDAGKSADRLSLFGIGGTLGKSRKPPPSVHEEDAKPSTKDTIKSDKHSSMSLARLYGGSTNKKGGRPGTSDGTMRSGSKEFKDSASTTTSPKDPALLRKRTTSQLNTFASPQQQQQQQQGPGGAGPIKEEDGSPVEAKAPQVKSGQSILAQIGEADHSGWMRKKGDRYNSWKLRYFVLKGPHMYCLRSNSKAETKIKGYINIVGYKVVVDENVHPGRYGFRIVHDEDKTHSFSSEEKTIVRDWMKAIMKATIGRDYTKAVISSCNIPTIPLTVAQAMNPAPRPPSPTARDATQKALRRENPHQLSSRDARVLMGLPSAAANGTNGANNNGSSSDSIKEERRRLDSFFSNHTVSSSMTDPTSPTSMRSMEASQGNMLSTKPPRPSRELRRSNTRQSSVMSTIDEGLVDWANTHLPPDLRIRDPSGPLCGGLGLLRLAESIKGRPSSPPVPDSAFPVDTSDDNLDGLFRLFDFLLDNDVKMGSVSINDVRQGKTDKIMQLLKALKAWEDRRKAIAMSIGKGSVNAGGFMAPVVGMQIVGM